MSPSGRSERGLAFLPAGADDTTLAKAAAANQREWIVRTARAGGGAVHRGRGATWVVSPRTACLAFPSLSAASGRFPAARGRERRARRRGDRGVLLVVAAHPSPRSARPPPRARIRGGLAGALDGDRARPSPAGRRPARCRRRRGRRGLDADDPSLRRRRIDLRPARARPGTAAPRLARRRLAGRAPGGACRRVRHGGKARRRRPLRRRGGAGQSVAAASGAP